MKPSVLRTAFLAAAGSLVMGGCGDQSALDLDDVMSEAGNLQKPKAGLYSSTTQMTDFKVPGLPPAQADRFQAQMSDVSSDGQPFCLTEAEAEKGFEEMLKTIGEGANGLSCAFTRFDVDAPALTAEMSCSDPMGGKVTIGFSGKTTDESLDLNMDMEAETAIIPGGSMEMVFTVKSQRIGECSKQDLASKAEQDAQATTGE